MAHFAGESGFPAWMDDTDADIATNAADIAAHLADTVDAHDATAVSFSPAQGLAATTVQAAIEEVVTDASATYLPILTPAETITYNADGTVATQVIGGVTTTYTYNGDGTVATEVRGGVTRTYTYNGDGTLASVA